MHIILSTLVTSPVTISLIWFSSYQLKKSTQSQNCPPVSLTFILPFFPQNPTLPFSSIIESSSGGHNTASHELTTLKTFFLYHGPSLTNPINVMKSISHVSESVRRVSVTRRSLTSLLFHVTVKN